MLEDALDDLPAFPLVFGAEEGARRRAEPERAVVTGLDVPRLLERQATVRGQSKTFAALPGLAEVRRALDGRAVDEVVRRDVHGAVVRDRVEDVPAGEHGVLDLPRKPVLVAPEDEEPFSGADKDRQTHDG